jgi:hypothetical protein
VLPRRRPIVVDGRLDEASWRLAPKSTPFVDIVTGEPAWFDTRVALLWDDDYLYFGFWVEETDVWGTMTKRDSKIWEENDVEVFIGGQRRVLRIRSQRAEYGVRGVLDLEGHSAAGVAVLRAAGVRPGDQRTMVLDGVGGHVHPRGERWGFLDWDFPGLKTAVHVDGVVNSRTNTDRGWTVELAFPWRGMADLADGRALPPKDGDVWRIDCSRFEKMGRNREVLDPCVGWTWNRHGHYDSHIPEVFPYVTFSPG